MHSPSTPIWRRAVSTEANAVVLKSGDRLSREEFHRRYCLTPEKFRAELIQGVVYVASPARYTVHGEPQGHVMGWLAVYATLVDGVRVGDNATVGLGPEDEVQPDAFLFRVPPPGSGAARITADDYIEGAPQLVIEVAASSAQHDLTTKLESYRRATVPEYAVWDTIEGQFHWYHLEAGRYVSLPPNEHGVIESKEFPGLRLHIPKLLAGDMAGVLAELATPAAG
jgi:Uma2 family endonuclease